MFIKMTRSGARPKALGLAIIVLAGLVFADVEAAAVQQCKPLLLPQKRTLFQRVVTHPGASLYASAGDSASVIKERLKPFSVFYVYERTTVNGTEWLQVGTSSNCQVIGWIDGTKASDWRQALTLMFTERTSRQPILFFKDLQTLEELAGSASPGEMATQLISQFEAIQGGKIAPPEEFPVIAVEPPEEAVARERFYLMPIFQTVELFEGVKFLEVASIDPGSWQLPGQTLPADSVLRTAIVFVIDTTISMRPYIERTREAVRRIYDAIETAGLADKVAFGLVAFRSSTKITPGLEYVSKVLSDLRDGRQRAAFEQALANTEEARVSSHSFNEDAFAGLKTALEELNWTPYQSRLIFLITDAGAIRNDDPYSWTGMN
ncbi:MAG: VWA domain-containing protein, partial [Desulfobacterales bacterium]